MNWQEFRLTNGNDSLGKAPAFVRPQTWQEFRLITWQEFRLINNNDSLGKVPALVSQQTWQAFRVNWQGFVVGSS